MSRGELGEPRAWASKRYTSYLAASLSGGVMARGSSRPWTSQKNSIMAHEEVPALLMASWRMGREGGV
jgi:hypothetical protein